MSDNPQYPEYPGPPQSGQSASPPPPGYNPPPPPGDGQVPPGYQAPSGYPPSYASSPQAPVGQYASWISRVGAYLIDSFLGMILTLPLIVIGIVLLADSMETHEDFDGFIVIDSPGDPMGWVLLGLASLLGIFFAVWNHIIRQGRKGQTLGKSVVGIHVVKEADGAPMGMGLALGRILLVSLLSSVTCYLNLLWPLWDDKKQALHDKVVSTVVIKK